MLDLKTMCALNFKIIFFDSVFMNDNENRSIPNGWLMDARRMLDLNAFKMLESVLMGCT